MIWVNMNINCQLWFLVTSFSFCQASVHLYPNLCSGICSSLLMACSTYHLFGDKPTTFFDVESFVSKLPKPVQLDINRLIDISLLLYLGGSKPWGWCYCMNNLFDKIATVVVRVSALRKVFSKKLKVENDNSWLETIMIHNYQVQM